MKKNVRVRALSCLGTVARGLGRIRVTEVFASRARARSTTRAVCVLLLSLVCAGAARAQGSPDVVWQGQHTGFLRYTAFSPDGQLLISGGDDRVNKVWQAADGTPLRTIVQCGGVGCVSPTFGFVSPDGQTLLTSGLRFWRINDGALQRRLGIGGNLALSPDWQYIVSSSFSSSYPGNETRTTTLFRLSDGSQVWTKADGGGQVAFSPDGQTVAAVGFQGIDIWRVSDGAFVGLIPGPRTLYAFTPDGQLVVTAGGAGGAVRYDNALKIYRGSDGAPGRTRPGGGGGSVNVSAPDGCSWRAVSHVNRINITGSNTGTGNGTVSYQTSRTGNDLTGLLIIAEQSFPVHLGDPSCTYTVGSDGTNFSPPGGAGRLGVSTEPGCGWGVTSNADWITITNIKGDSGGNGVTYSVAPNGGPPRSGTISIAGQTVTVNQLTDPCSFSVYSNTSTTYDSNGGNGSANVAASNHCPWTVTTDADWITLSTTGGTGNATAFYFVNAKTTPGSRTGHVTIAGQTFMIFQTGLVCDFSISPSSRSFTSEGGSAYINVAAQSACGWTAKSNADWITITYGAPGSGYGAVYYSVAPYNGTAPRSGTITLAGGLTFTVRQGVEPLQGPPDIVWTGTGHTASANAVAFSPDGQLLASASKDHTVKVWRVSDGALLATLTGFSDSVTSVAFSHSGQMLAAGSVDRTLRVWNVSDWSPIQTVVSTDFILGIAFSPDDSRLAEGGGYSGFWIHVLRTSDWQQIALLGSGQAANNPGA